ncbi:Uncharacterized protein FKW44_018566, partial [Caligus rogercresseyi]
MVVKVYLPRGSLLKGASQVPSSSQQFFTGRLHRRLKRVLPRISQKDNISDLDVVLRPSTIFKDS